MPKEIPKEIPPELYEVYNMPMGMMSFLSPEETPLQSGRVRETGDPRFGRNPVKPG